MSPVVITIFFVGIAAFVNVPPGSDVKRMVIFPSTPAGSEYKGVQLAPHRTLLHVPGAGHIATEKKTACEVEYKGDWNETTNVCTIALSGALLWTRTSEALLEDEHFRKIPSFGALCPDAVDLSARYTDRTTIDSKFVAAHVDITGGTATGCKRSGGAFVTKLDVKTDDGALYVRQGGATRRILLNTGAVVAIENREEAHLASHSSLAHYGWYHFMTKESINCPIQIPAEADVPRCPAMPGVVEAALRAMTSSSISVDCSNGNYP